MGDLLGGNVNRRDALLAAAAGVAGFGLMGSAASAQTPVAGGSALTDEVILAGLQAAGAKATEIGVPMVVAIIDRSGAMRGYLRQDGTRDLSAVLVPQKAYTAAMFAAPTSDLAERFGSDPVALASFMKVENVTLLGGGLPITAGGAPVGGIGAGGGSQDQDAEVAAAGLAAMGLE
jgi:uncharacterized protein GlcG (DUF336 family)